MAKTNYKLFHRSTRAKYYGRLQKDEKWEKARHYACWWRQSLRTVFYEEIIRNASRTSYSDASDSEENCIKIFLKKKLVSWCSVDGESSSETELDIEVEISQLESRKYNRAAQPTFVPVRDRIIMNQCFVYRRLTKVVKRYFSIWKLQSIDRFLAMNLSKQHHWKKRFRLHCVVKYVSI